MLAHGLRRCGWLLVLLAGCDLLPPPPPPKLRSAPAVTPETAKSAAKPASQDADFSFVPRDENSAPNEFQAKFETTKGTFVISVHRDWAPRGADRFYQLVKEGFYDNCRFFRVVPGFVVQWGMNGDPKINEKYQHNNIRDDRFKTPNRRGTVVFANSGPNSRSSQLFINFADNVAGSKSDLDSQKFTPFGEVVEGMKEVVDKISSEYGEKVDQQLIARVGNTYLDERFPNLDYIIKATIVGEEPQPAATTEPAAPSQAPADSASQPTDAGQPANAPAQ